MHVMGSVRFCTEQVGLKFNAFYPYIVNMEKPRRPQITGETARWNTMILLLIVNDR